MLPPPPRSTLFPYTTLFRSHLRRIRGNRFWIIRLFFEADDALVAVRFQHTEMVCGLRSEEHTSELQSHSDLVCRLLLEKKKKEFLPVVFPSFSWHKMKPDFP